MTARVFTANPAFFAPRLKTTFAGVTDAKRVLLTESATAARPGAGPVSVTAPLTDPPPRTQFGDSVTESTTSGNVKLASLECAVSPHTFVACPWYMYVVL